MVKAGRTHAPPMHKGSQSSSKHQQHALERDKQGPRRPGPASAPQTRRRPAPACHSPAPVRVDSPSRAVKTGPGRAGQGSQGQGRRSHRVLEPRTYLLTDDSTTTYHLPLRFSSLGLFQARLRIIGHRVGGDALYLAPVCFTSPSRVVLYS